MQKDKALFRKILTWIGIAALVYFGNVQLQTWLGHRALQATGLEIHTLDEGLSLADASDRLVLANVSAIWCSSCRTFDREVLGDEAVRQLIESEFVFVRLEYESAEGKAFREDYGINGFPRVLVLDPDGRLLTRLPTVFDAGVFRAALERVS
jgi:thiol:disulfide interchange protein